MPNDIVIGSTRVSLYDISQQYRVPMDQLYTLNPEFSRGTTDGKFNLSIELQKISNNTTERDGDYVQEGEIITLPDSATGGPFYFYKSDISTYQREAALNAVGKAAKAKSATGGEGLSQEEFVAVASKTKGVSSKQAEDLFHELARKDVYLATGAPRIASDEIISGQRAATKAGDRERAKEATAAEHRKIKDEAAKARAVAASSEPAATTVVQEVKAADATGIWASAYSWLRAKHVQSSTTGLNRVTFYAAWATPQAGAHPVFQFLSKNLSPRTAAVSYGLAQFFQGFKPGSDPLYTGAKVSEMGIAAGLYFNNVVTTLATKNDPKTFTQMEKWLNGQLNGQALVDFVADVNKAMESNPKASESLTYIQQLVYGARKPGQTFAHDVVIKGFSVAMALDIANIATKYGNLILRKVDSDPKNDPSAAEMSGAGRDAAMSLGKHAPLLYTTMKGRAAIQAGFSQQAQLLEKAKGEAQRASYFDDLAKKAEKAGDQALGKQFGASKAHFQTLEKQSKELSEKVVRDARVVSTKWMRGGFAMMDAAFAIKNEFELTKFRENVRALEAQLANLPKNSPDVLTAEKAIKEMKYQIRSFEDSRLSNVVNVAAHVTPLALYKDVADLVLAVGLPTLDQYKSARAKLGLDPGDLEDPLAGLFTTTSPSIYLTQKAVERGVSELGTETAADILYQKKMSESTKALLQSMSDNVTEMLKYFKPVLLPPLMPTLLLRF